MFKFLKVRPEIRKISEIPDSDWLYRKESLISTLYYKKIGLKHIFCFRDSIFSLVVDGNSVDLSYSEKRLLTKKYNSICQFMKGETLEHIKEVLSEL